jgi:hypothetical protein
MIFFKLLLSRGSYHLNIYLGTLWKCFYVDNLKVTLLACLVPNHIAKPNFGKYSNHKSVARILEATMYGKSW